MPRIVILGGGGHARVVASILKRMPGYNVIGYTAPDNVGVISGLAYLGTDDVLPTLVEKNPDCAAVLGIGTVGPNPKRELLFTRLEELGFSLITVVAPRALVGEGVPVGRGTVVVDGAIVNTGSSIGKGVILNTNCTVDHDCVIGDFVHVAPGATLSGGVSVGRNAMIGVGATVIQNVRIGEGILVGAGSTVIKNLDTPGTYFGSPARRIG
jgi:sugar O-acyltransferase (sialic acid O-acetyltransferase NeuD family)